MKIENIYFKIVSKIYKITAITGILIFLFLSHVMGFTIRQKNNSANKLFYRKEYRKALNIFDELEKRLNEKDKKLNSIVNYNRANTLLKLKNFDEAKEYYDQALSITENKKKMSNIYYNLGNTAYRRGELDEALRYYMETLDLNPDDVDAKYNIELIKKKIEEQKQEEQESKEKEEEEEEKEKNDKKDQEKENKKDKENEKEQEEKKTKEEEEEEKEEEQQEKKEELSKEDAIRILKALEQRERETRKEEKVKISGRSSRLKDW